MVTDISSTSNVSTLSKVTDILVDKFDSESQHFPAYGLK